MHFAFFPHPVLSQPKLLFLQAPTGEIMQDSLVRLVIARMTPPGKMQDSCGVYRSASPAGSQLAGHGSRLRLASQVLSPDSSARILAFRPADPDSAGLAPQLGLGFHYLIGACPDGNTVTPELPVMAVTRQAASFLTPKALEPSGSPTVSWTAVPGVPAYHLLLSDQALAIDPDKGSVSGASIIWQAITTRNSIAYGTPDPSGNFAKVPAPPLSPGVPYNLVILNNYDGRSALATSAKAQGLKLFSIQSPAVSLSPPRNLAPGPGQILSAASDSSIRFQWTASLGAGGVRANTYKVYVYSLETQDGTDILLPIWQSEVTDTFALIDAKRTLLDKRYIWKIFSLGESGAGVVGDTTSFQYRNNVQSLSLAALALGGAGDTVLLGDVRIDVTPLDGGADALPLFTPSSGRVEKTLAVGSYSLEFSKDGYVSRKRLLALDGKGLLQVDQFLPAAACRITGRMVDGDGARLDNVRVTASGSGPPVSALSDAQGFYLLGVPAGNYAVSFAKPDYQARPDTVVALLPGKSADLGSLPLQQAKGSLSGSVANDKGLLLSGCRIIIKGSPGTPSRSLLTDDKGAFSAFLSPGSYTVTASRTGFTSEEKTVRLSESAHLGFQLASGASVLKGKVSLLAVTSPGTSQSTPQAGVALTLQALATGAVQKAEADLRGEFSFSADTGAYFLRAALPGKARPDSALVRVTAPRSTVVQDMLLRGLAAVQGRLILFPDAAVDPSLAAVSLLRSPSLELALTTTAVRGSGGGLVYSLEGVPDGDYRLACGLPGYGLAPEPSLAVRDGIWMTGVDLNLRQADKSIAFSLRQGNSEVPGTIRLLTPRRTDLPAGTKLAPAASGTYVLTAVADSASLLPLSRYSFVLPAAGAADTTVPLSLPFSHQPIPLFFHEGTVELSLATLAPADSVLLVYGYGAPTDSFRVPRADLAGPVQATRILRFNPGPRGGLLGYYFVVRSGPFTYANDEAARRFHAQVEPSPDLASLRVDAGDSLNLPARSRCVLRVHAYDAAGNRLDTAVDRRGKVSWSAPAGLPVKLENRAGRILTLSVGDVPKPKAGASASANRFAEGLSVTVTLDSLSSTLTLPAHVVPARINKLALSSTLGETAELSSPGSFGLFAAGFDTTTVPPTPLTPHAVFTLEPPQAGSIREEQVDLHPRFIGPLRILAVHTNPDGIQISTELGAARDSLRRGLNVGQILRPGDTARVLFHDPFFEMRVPDSALASQGQSVLRVFKRRLAKTFTSGVSEVLAGELYEVSNPSGVSFAKRLRPSLGIPRNFQGRRSALRRFDTGHLEWIDLRDSVADTANSFAGPALAADIRDLDGSYYGLLSASRALSAGEVEIIPNPFSPLVHASRDGNTQYGTRIRFRPESDRSAEVTVSLKIYNLDGELVRLLVDHKTVPKVPVDFYWDGKTDGGRWARNGRYLLKLSLKATGTRESRHLVKNVVVFQ